MRIAIRADASKAIGTGHVMRQIALAQYLLSENHEVILFGSITGPDWLRKYVESQSGLVWREVKEGNFSAASLLAGEAFDALVIDSYALGQRALELLEEKIPTLVMVDGPWQDLRGKLAITATFEKNPFWASEYQKRFEEHHCGPEFFMLRREVIELQKKRPKRNPNRKPSIAVALGGSDFGGHTDTLLSALSGTCQTAKIDVFVPRPANWAGFKAEGEHAIHFHEAGPEFLEYLGNADLAVTAAGTTAAEVSFLGIEAIFIPVAVNQQENAKGLRAMEVGTVLDLDHYEFSARLAGAVRKALHPRKVRPPSLITSGGAERVAKVLNASVR